MRTQLNPLPPPTYQPPNEGADMEQGRVLPVAEAPVPRPHARGGGMMQIRLMEKAKELARPLAEFAIPLSQRGETVQAGDYSFKPALRHAGKTLLKGAANAGAIAAGYYVSQEMVYRHASEQHRGQTQGFLAAGLLFPVYMSAQKLFLGMIKAARKGCLDPIQAAQVNYENRRRSRLTPGSLSAMPRYIRDPVELIDGELMELFRTAEHADKESDKAKLLSRIKRLMRWQKDYLLDRNESLKPVEGWTTAAGRQRFLQQIEDELAAYDGNDKLQSDLHAFLVGFAARSVERTLPAQVNRMRADGDDLHHWNEVPTVPKNNLLCLGVPGGGKGRFIAIVSKLTNRGVGKLVVPPLMNDGAEALLAKKWQAIRQEEYATRDHDLLGEAGLHMASAKCRNTILNLDEPNWEDTAGIKRLTDPFKGELEASCLETSFRFLDTPIIITSNNVPKREDDLTAEQVYAGIDDAIDDRMNVALFGETSAQSLRASAIRAYRDIASLYCLPHAPQDGRAERDGHAAEPGEPVLDVRQQKRMQQIFKQVLDELVERHQEKIPGMRMHQPVEQIVTFIVVRLLRETAPGESKPQLTEADVRQVIEGYYAPKRPRNPYRRPEHAPDGGKGKQTEAA